MTTPSKPTQHRHPVGSPAGGQFAPGSRAESGTDLAATAAVAATPHSSPEPDRQSGRSSCDHFQALVFTGVRHDGTRFTCVMCGHRAVSADRHGGEYTTGNDF